MRKEKITRPEKLTFFDSVIFEGDALTVLSRLPDCSVQAAITSPPYWGLRDYSIPDQLGLEGTLAQYINALRSIFTEVRRVLKDDGIFWLNIGMGTQVAIAAGARLTRRIRRGRCPSVQIRRTD
jgi:site-specific DNA-methyltransferase (cytosine-N4-specific)